jgi:hypothetical protein
MQKRIVLSAIVALCTLAGAAQAAERIVMSPVALAPNASIGENIKRECGVEGVVSKEVSQRVSERFPLAEQSQAPDQDDGETLVLKVTILAVSGFGGGSWSGAKSMAIQADVLRNGAIGASHMLSRSSKGGVFGGMSGTCAIMDRIAVALGRDVAAWLPIALATARKAPVAEPAAAQTKP